MRIYGRKIFTACQRLENFGGHGHSDTRFFYKKNLHKKMSLKNPKTLRKG